MKAIVALAAVMHLTLAHAAPLYFEGRKEAAKKRLQKLKEAGLVGERPD